MSEIIQLQKFPNIPKETKKTFSFHSSLKLRPFGTRHDDLDIDFTQISMPHIITKILQCCTLSKNNTKIDSDFFWELPIGTRIECLLLVLSFSSSVITFRHRCKNEKCAELFELDIPVDNIIAIQTPFDDFKQITLETSNITIRKPCGKDQILWKSQNYVDDKSMKQSMLHSLIISSNISKNDYSEKLVEQIEKKLDEIDPLINFSEKIKCPNCSASYSYDVKLEYLILQNLKQIQDELLDNIHVLASKYGWDETQILRLPPWRRIYYLKKIDGEES